MLPLALALLLSAPATDVSFEQTTWVQAPGSPAGAGVKTRVFYAGRRMRLETGDEGGPALVLRLDDGRAFRLDPAQRVAVELDVARLRARAHQDAAMAGDLMGARGARPQTTPLSKVVKVAGYACRGFRIAAGAVTLDVYVTRELPLGMERFAELLEWTGAAASLGPIVDALRAIEGFPLETRSRVMVLDQAQETRTSVTRVKLEPLAPGLFEIPQGYTVVRDAAAGEETP